MLKKYLKILSNTVLYYQDNEGNSVFRNFCLFDNTACRFNSKMSKEDVCKTLEFRIRLNKKFRNFSIIIPIILYFIFIHIDFSIFMLILFEIFWIISVNCVRFYMSKTYSDFLIEKFGEYELGKFSPKIPRKTEREFINNFFNKIILGCILLGIFFTPSFGLKYLIIKQTNSGKHYKSAVVLSNVYLMFYPKVAKIYDMKALSECAMKDYESALKDFKTSIKLSGTRFNKYDYMRFANLLYLEKRISNPTKAIDLFNELLTKKSLTLFENSQMLWVKSMFKIENDVPQGIIGEYDEIINSIKQKKYKKEKFYLSADKAYMLYLLKDYASAADLYDALISYANKHSADYEKALPALFIERGYAKMNMGDYENANMDFLNSGITLTEIPKFEPKIKPQDLFVEKF